MESNIGNDKNGTLNCSELSSLRFVSLHVTVVDCIVPRTEGFLNNHRLIG